MKKFFKDFGAFIARGNAIDLAVGIVIGGAFNNIIKSLVNDIIMPLISLIAKTDIAGLYWVMKGTATFDDVTGQIILSEGAILLTYGKFFQSILDFFIIALAIFIAIRIIARLKKQLDDAKELLLKKKVVEPAAIVAPQPAKPTQEELLTEIRDLLKPKA